MKHGWCKLAFCKRWAIVLLTRTIKHLAYGRQRLWKVNYVKFHLVRLQDRRISHWRIPISMRRLSPLATDWTSFIREKSASAPTSYPLLHQMPFSKCFTIVSGNSISSLNQMIIASITNSFKQLSQMTVFFGQFFSRCLFIHFKRRSSWKKWAAQHQLVLRGVLNDEFHWLSTSSPTTIRSHFPYFMSD